MKKQLYYEDPYKILEIDRNATDSEIKTAYFSKLRLHSPEKDPIGFQRMRTAYEKLRDKSNKIQTDLFLPHNFGDSINKTKLKFPENNVPEPSLKNDVMAVKAYLMLKK